MRTHLIYRRSPYSDDFSQAPEAIVTQTGKLIYLHPYGGSFGPADKPTSIVWGAYTPKLAAAAAKLNRQWEAFEAARDAFEKELEATQGEVLAAAKAAPRDVKPVMVPLKGRLKV